jgi:cytochrome c5
VHRVRARSTLEDVSDRYGLSDDAVQMAFALGGSLVAFVLDQSIAMADGKTVERYAVEATSGASGGVKRVAALGAGGRVVVLDVEPETLTIFSVPSAMATAIDAEGHVFVQTAQSIHELRQDGPALVYRSTSANLHGFVTCGGRVWFGEGTKLGALEARKVGISASDVISAEASLLTSPSGALWTISAGKLSRFEVPATGDEGVWQTTVRPIYAHTCSACHKRGGTANIDLSTYAAWAERRSRIYDRVVVRKDMPQGGTLADADIEAIRAWAMSP